MRLLSFTALLSSALILSACGEDTAQPPDQPMPPVDTTAPRLTATTPTRGAQGLAPGAVPEVSFTFSEPMDPAAGTLVPSGELELGVPAWSGNTLKAPVTRLGHDAALAVELRGFKDLAGNTLDGTVLLGNSTLDFHTGTDRPRPHVTASSVAEGAQGEYPVELFYDAQASRPGVYSRKRLSLTFSTAMQQTLAQVRLENRTDTTVPPRTLTGEWSENGRVLSLTLLSPEEGGPPLEEESAYALDLSALRGAEVGNRLDATAFLSDGKLDFTTGKRDGSLEHACAHTLINTPEAVMASANRPPFGFPPPTDTGHTRYRVTLPGEGPYEGHTELTSKTDEDEDIALYLSREIPVGAFDDIDGVDVPVQLTSAPPACAAITHVARFSIARGDRFYILGFGPTDAAKFDFVLERYAK